MQISENWMMTGVTLFFIKLSKYLMIYIIFFASNAVCAQEKILVKSFYEDFKIKNFAEMVKVKLQPTLPPTFRGSVGQLINSTVAVLGENSNFGSGVVLSDEMVSELQLDKKFGKGFFVATVEHVVSENQEYAVIFYDQTGSGLDTNEITMAIVLETDKTKDLALLKITTKPDYVTGSRLHTFRDDVAIGDDVQAVGHPNEMWWTYTRGYISQFRENYEWVYDDASAPMKADVIQTQTPITTGNSGGPLFSKTGKVLGLNAFGDPEFQSINFAIHADEIKDFIGELVGTGDTIIGVLEVIIPEQSMWRKLNELDNNEDGKIDALLYDSNNDGAIDLVEIDNNFDGLTDYFEFDIFGDFSFGLRYYPPNEKHFASWHLDSDRDDIFDLEGSDEDQDGVPDSLKRL